MTKISDLVEYIWKHPSRDKAFPAWSKDQLALGFLKGFKQNAAAFSTTETGQINGCILCEPHVTEKILYVYGWIMDDPKAIKGMLFLKKKFFSGWKLQARRHGQIKTFNNLMEDRFISKLV